MADSTFAPIATALNKPINDVSDWIFEHSGPHHLGLSRTPGHFYEQNDKKTAVKLTTVTLSGDKAYLYRTRLGVDFDGSTKSYAPPISQKNLFAAGGLTPREHTPKNATNMTTGIIFHPNGVGNTFEWKGVESAKPSEAAGRKLDNKPGREFLKDGNGRFPIMQPSNEDWNYYEPQGAMRSDDGHFVDSETVPFGALPHSMALLGVKKGDFGLAIRSRGYQFTPFIFADAKGSKSTGVGEYSFALIDRLGLSLTPKNNVMPDEDVCFLVFKGSSLGKIAHPSEMFGQLNNLIRKLSFYDNVDKMIEQWTTQPNEFYNIKNALIRFGFYQLYGASRP